MDEIIEEVIQATPEPVDPWEVVSVTNLVWANEAQTIITCSVVYKWMEGIQPFAANATDPELHCREIFRRATVDEEWGVISPYVPPSPAEVRANMQPLEKWRFEAIIDIYGVQNSIDLRGNIDAAVEALPEPDRTIAKSKRQNVNLYYRDDALFDLIGASVAISPEGIDALWATAAAL